MDPLHPNVLTSYIIRVSYTLFKFHSKKLFSNTRAIKLSLSLMSTDATLI